MRSKVILGCVLVLCIVSVLLTVKVYAEVLATLRDSLSSIWIYSDLSWVVRLFVNLLGYSIILLPGYIVFKYLRVTKYFDRISSPTVWSRCLFSCFGDPGSRLPTSAPPPADTKSLRADTERARGAELVFCFSGLMGAYLVWGLLQEKIMTQVYTMPDGSVTKFEDSQFLVFVNRLSALLVAGARLACAGAPLAAAPLYKFSYCSLTNILSAWCQYEALKYVSFPTQVLSKSCKVLPVMAMGRAVSGNKYSTHEYVTAALISLGMVLFLLGTGDDHSVSTVMTVSGLALLALYMLCDSFTSSWQNQLFNQYHVTPLQMMCGVNMFSCLLTGVSLIRPETYTSLQLLKHPVFLADCALLSASSALGQLLIYRTIAKFGAVVFTIIMTLRQAVAILLSCLVYGHAVTWPGGVGIALVFGAVLLRIYCRQRLQRARRANV